MQSVTARVALVLALPLSSLEAQTAAFAPRRDEPRLVSWVSREAGLLRGNMRIDEASGARFLLWVSPDDPHRVADPRRFSLGSFALDAAGTGTATVTLPTWFPNRPGRPLFTGATVLQGTGVIHVPGAPLEEPQGETLDFDWGLGGVTQHGGTIVSSAQPWSSLVTVSAVNANPGHPNACILFDSSNPTPGEEDLRTPGTGAGNDQSLGMLLVVAADLTDADLDGLVDAPRAEPAGGTLAFDFGGPSTVGRITFVNVEEPGGEIRLIGSGGTQTVAIQVGGTNSVTNEFGGFGFDRMEVDLPGRAAIAELTINGCLAAMNFDQSTTGVPLGLPAGTDFYQASDAYSGLLLYYTAENAAPGHPDVPLLFDSANPTGGDTDLVTPGYGAGNTRPLGMVLVIGEDDVDANNDGLVDDPDDEAMGGMIRMSYYTSDAFFRGATVLDVDTYESAWIEVHLNQGGSTILPLQSLGDNSVQTISAEVGPTRTVDFHFTGSAALAEVVVCPDF